MPILLRLTSEVDRTVEELMWRTDLPKAGALNMAVGFLRATAGAIAEGKRVGFAGEDQGLDIEFTGL